MRHLTLKAILKRATSELNNVGIDSAGLDTRVLLEAAIGMKSSYILAHPEAPMINAEYSKFRRYIRRRKKGEPVAYILGHKEFYGLDFIVNKNVLIPRPETEWLVEEAIQRIKCNSVISNGVRNLQLHEVEDFSPRGQMARNDYLRDFRILDMGTGSGCIIISLVNAINNIIGKIPRSLHFPDNIIKPLNTRYYATDISKKALLVAKKNAKRHKVADLIKFYHSDLFANPQLPKKFDLIIANLPYVPGEITNKELRIKDRTDNRNSYFLIPNSISFEPQAAIFSNDNGSAIIKRFLREVPNRINKDGMILIELDPRNARELCRFAQKQFPQAKIELKKDLAGLDRYLKILL